MKKKNKELEGLLKKVFNIRLQIEQISLWEDYDDTYGAEMLADALEHCAELTHHLTEAKL